MKSKILVCMVAAALGGAAMAQTSATTNSGTTTHGTSSTGIATPPPGTSAPLPKRLDHSNASVLGNNTPTLPQIALHPTATIGSPVPVAGPGGTSSNPTGD